jgi:peptide-methionine (R)-S-oxide reductase
MKRILIILALLPLLIACAQKPSEKKFVVNNSTDTIFQNLDDFQKKVMCGGGTEKAFTGKYLYNKADGVYACAACQNPLFTSETKFDSGSGWPSFFEQIDKTAIKEIVDTSFGMKRTEIVCSKCGGHLGHVFEDGPEPTGLRYCVNSASLFFLPSKEK